MSNLPKGLLSTPSYSPSSLNVRLRRTRLAATLRRQSLTPPAYGISAEDRAQLLGGQDVLHPPERAVLAHGERSFAHRREGQPSERAADAHPPDAGRFELLKREARVGESHDHVHGFGTAATSVRMVGRSRMPGAYSTSGPAAAKACSRRIVSSRSARPCRKFSARATTVKGNGSLRASSTAPATRSTAREKSEIGFAASPVASSSEPPTAPASAASRMITAASVG